MRNLTSLVVLLLASSALAQTERVIQEPDRTVVRKNTVIHCTSVEIESGIARPADSYVLIPDRAGRFRSLIKVRGDFVPELQKSADNL